MPLSRRQLLGSIGAGLALTLGGCIGSGDSDGANDTDPDSGNSSPDATDETTDSADGPPFVATLVGPDEEHQLFDRSGVEAVGEIDLNGSTPSIPVTLTEERTTAISDVAQRVELPEHLGEYEVVIRHDGEELHRAPITQELARDWAAGDWEGQFVMEMPSMQEAQRVHASIA